MSESQGSVTRKILERHLVEGSLDHGGEIGLRIDQTLTQDATGTLVMLELEALGIDRVRTEISAQYGQGSSREHAALAPRFLGLRVVLAEGFARIHRQNLVSHGVLPLVVANGGGRERLAQGRVIAIRDVRTQLEAGPDVNVEVDGTPFETRHELSPRQVAVLLAGGLVNHTRERLRRESG